jgi:hypothetical protein
MTRKGGHLKELIGSNWTAQTFADLIAAQEVARLAIGQSRAIWLYIVPAATWRAEVAERYEGLEPRPFSLRDLRSQVKVASIVADQVDVDGQPNAYGAIYKRDVLYAYLVPGDAYWRDIVEAAQ